jgi:CheY-like chemotaxis protein
LQKFIACGAKLFVPRKIMKNSQDHIKVLVIGSNFERLSEMFEAFERAGFGLAFASGGREGLRAMRVERPDVALCEIGLHDMTGLQLCRAVRSDPMLSDIGFMMIAKSYHDTQNVLDALAAGADDCLTERSLMAHLIAKIVWMVSRRRLENNRRSEYSVIRSRQTQLASLLKDAASMLAENIFQDIDSAPDLMASLAGLLDEQVNVLEKLSGKPPGYAQGPAFALGEEIAFELAQAM